MSDSTAIGTAAIEIPFGQLSSGALAGVLESFVLREGTDYGAVEHSFEEKVAQLRRAVERGEARIMFDPQTESITLLPTR
jgi:uncharacterized protein YheU (UPF0270 family)